MSTSVARTIWCALQERKEHYLGGAYSIMICLLCCVVKAADVGGSQGVADDQT